MPPLGNRRRTSVGTRHWMGNMSSTQLADLTCSSPRAEPAVWTAAPDAPEVTYVGVALRVSSRLIRLAPPRAEAHKQALPAWEDN